jgi:predicted neuraminidase
MMRRLFAAWLLVLGFIAGDTRAAEPSITRTPIFPPNAKHNHASCVVELKNGRLLAAWYAGSGEREADDVVIEGAWLEPGASKWGGKFLMADTPGYPDCNPALFAAPDRSLWVFWPTILDHHWEGALLKYARCSNASGETARPQWTQTGVVHVTPENFDVAMKRAIAGLSAEQKEKYRSMIREAETRSGDLLYQRLGWMPRVHLLVLPTGRWILPLYTDTFSVSLMAISDDQGESWTCSTPLIGWGNIQPSLVRRNDGHLVAFMRDNGPHRRIRLSSSTDDGMTWSPVVDSEFPNPGAGIEAIRLRSGRWLLVYNDLAKGRYSLAASLSDDEGKSWKWTQHIERSANGVGLFHYPSVIQASDDSIHVTYTQRRPEQGSTILHARFDEIWLITGKGE